MNTIRWVKRASSIHVFRTNVLQWRLIVLLSYHTTVLKLHIPSIQSVTKESETVTPR